MLRTFDYETTPVKELVDDILYDSAKRGASDIHFDPQDDHLRVRIRIDGDLLEYTEIPALYAKNIVTKIKILAGMNITESRLPQDGAIKGTINEMDLDLRVSALPTKSILGEKIVIRILDYSLSLAGLESLGFTPENYKKVIKMISSPNGIILVTGATGSGKSTTLYSILQKLNKENVNIITVEDPVEMDIQGVNQIQTNSEIGLDFATVLRSILRQDPNIIMIGEIRDTETAKIAVRASITGHLVLSTIHTNNSLNTIERLLDMDVERYLLASALTGIISQKLARRLCPHCKKLRPTNEYEKSIIKKITGKEINEIYTAVGCDKCKHGYSGRIAIQEVLLINQDIKDAISSNMKKDKLRHLVYSSDVISLLNDGINKVLNGDTTLEELLKIIELDDDETLHSTGLNNAIEDNEIAKSEEDIEDNKKIVNENIDNIVDDMFNENNIKKDNNILENSDKEEDINETPVIDTNSNDTKEELNNNIVDDNVDIKKDDNIIDNKIEEVNITKREEKAKKDIIDKPKEEKPHKIRLERNTFFDNKKNIFK